MWQEDAIWVLLASAQAQVVESPPEFAMDQNAASFTVGWAGLGAMGAEMVSA